MTSNGTISVFEFDLLSTTSGDPRVKVVPRDVFDWLAHQCIVQSEDVTGPKWLRPRLSRGKYSIQVLNYVGVIKTPMGFQIEVLPKSGRADQDEGDARSMLIQMLACLGEFRHLRTRSAELTAQDMPLLEVFISEFLQAVRRAVQRGLRSRYEDRRDNLYALRGKFLVAQNIKANLVRPDRFFTEHDEFN